MKAFLLHRDRDADRHREPPPNEEALRQDLGLDILLAAMAGEDAFLLEVARRDVLSGLDDPEAIVYRQELLRDGLEQPAVVRRIYDVAVGALDGARRVPRSLFSNSPERTLYRAVQLLELFQGALRELRDIADAHASEFRSQGWTRFFAMLGRELDDAYLEAVENHLRELHFRHGVLISAALGRGNRGGRYVLRRPADDRRGWRGRIVALARPPGRGFKVADRDEAGARALSELRNQGLNSVAGVVGQSADHIASFLDLVRAEVGFYVACLNLHDRLAEKGEPTCFPVPCPPGRPVLAAEGLYDACLTLTLGERVVGNGFDADGRPLVMVTGANQGGKSTFLRSLGVAQLMMQSGMFVAADSFRADVRDRLFTHFKREEDATMESGKLDEELARMSDIADHLGPAGLLLCNESFAATNELEGSEIARQIVRALLDAGVKVLFVTHMFDLAHGFYEQPGQGALFLRAEREPDGRRTFRLIEAEPLTTSFGQDVYRRVFGAGGDPVLTAATSMRER